MAKSIRSKRMRKLRAIKRIRYGEKELERLKKMLSNAAAEEQIQKEEAEETKQAIEASQMEIDTVTKSEEKAKTTNPKYPCWMSHFKIRRLAKQERRRKRKEEKRLKKQGKLLTKNHRKSNKRFSLTS